MGRSSKTYVSAAAAHGDRLHNVDEVWAINAMGSVIQHDRLFVMDDLKEITGPAALKKPGRCADGMMRWLHAHPGPVYTSRAYPDEYPGTVEYPLQDVIRAVGNVYFNNSVAYAVGYAIATGVKELGLYGCDFSYPAATTSNHAVESGRACVEMLLGMAMVRGIAISIAAESTLFDSDSPRRFYGYVRQPTIEMQDGKWTITGWQDVDAG
jgi:hypothetical protein